MTLDQLVELDADQWDTLTDEQLMEIFQPFLTVTRPELAKQHKPKQTSNQNAPVIVMSEAKRKALAALAAEGVDMGFLNRLKQRRG